MLRPSLIFFGIAFANIAATATIQTCYSPNGTAILTDPCCGGIYSPCNSTGVSMCCAIGRPVYHINTCIGNGLCEDVSTGWIWRESCSDPTWKDPRCLKLCMEDMYLTLDTGNAMLTACPDGSYCCGNGNATCCAKGEGYLILTNGDIIPAASATAASAKSTSASPATQSASVTSTATSVSASSTQASPSPASSTSNKPTLSIGLGVGLGAGLPLAAGVLVLALCLRKKQDNIRNSNAAQEELQSPEERLEKEEPKYVVTESVVGQKQEVQELHSEPAAAVELSGEGKVFEK